ncbi:MAG: type II toxin-antitoxin system Phd/YefM family antitoxin [Acidobacteriota bacterium]|nr:type II toxin-antitoxin system Phd/YefM family antitoxin [Acidobacteriota bacterium]
MRTVSQSDALATLPALIDGLKSQSVIIQRDGEAVAVIVAPEEFELIRRQKAQRLFDSMDAIAESVESNVKDDSDVRVLLSILDRKAS